ncbi:MAG: sulfoacetaldehyde acetyltransferase [Acidimicrobiia bacterium]|nr:sulfoacetaldehyde acetyltransferase [Acidimicrobiia bacterium]
MTRMTSSEAFVETMVAQGVTDVFGIVGSAYMDALDIFEPAGIRFWSVAHEQAAAHMADGYSRVSGRHGVCIAQNGPGITNFVTAIAAAYWAHSPVVCITPQTGSMGIGKGGFQETNQMPIFEEITKYQVQVNRHERMAEHMHRAFTLAMAERGPVQVNIPRDLFYGEADYDIQPPLTIERAAGGAASLDAAADALAAAEFPVIIAGGGVIMANGTQPLMALAEYLQAPVVNSYLHNDSFPASHELAAGPLGYQGSKAAMRLISQADVILALGSRLGPFGTLPQHGIEYWPENAKVIQVDIDHRMLGLVQEVEVAVHGDAAAAAKEILDRLQSRDVTAHSNADARKAEIAKQKADWAQELTEWSSSTDMPMAPRRALRELEMAMPADAMVTTDIGNICSVANSYLNFDRPNSLFAAMMWGNCGYAFPTAMGAKIAAPERPAIAYVGDGAWGMSMAEIMTCVREDIPVVAVVFNNQQWGAEKKNQIDFYEDRYVGTDLENPSFAKISEAMGGNGIKVEKPDEVGDALREAVASNRPTVLEIMVSRELGEPFRRDALNLPVRLLEKYEKYGV